MGDGAAQCRCGVLAGVAGGGDLEQDVRVGQRDGRGALAEAGASLVAAGAQGDVPVADAGQGLAIRADGGVVAGAGQPGCQDGVDVGWMPAPVPGAGGGHGQAGRVSGVPAPCSPTGTATALYGWLATE